MGSVLKSKTNYGLVWSFSALLSPLYISLPGLESLAGVDGAEHEVGAVGGEQGLDGGEGLDQVGGAEEDEDEVAALVLRDLECLLGPALDPRHLHSRREA